MKLQVVNEKGVCFHEGESLQRALTLAEDLVFDGPELCIQVVREDGKLLKTVQL